MFYPGLLTSGPKNDSAGKAIGRFGMAIAVASPAIALTTGIQYGTRGGEPYVFLFF